MDNAIALHADLHIDNVRCSIKDYSAINMRHGVFKNVDCDSSWDIADDLERHVYAPLAIYEKSESLDAALAKKLHGGVSDFLAFDEPYQTLNRKAFCVAVSGVMPECSTLKRRFFSALNKVQRSYIPFLNDQIVVSFAEEPQFRECLKREGLFGSYSENFYFEKIETRSRIFASIRDAMEYIRAVDPILHDIIVETIGTIVCFRREGSSGSVSSLVGSLWLNPNDDWTVVDYAENIVHEYIHNSIFLADMTRKIFNKPHYVTTPEFLIVTAILKYPRNFNIAFHSLFVSIGLHFFLRRANQISRADQVVSGAALTLQEILGKPEHLAEHGSFWLDRLLMQSA